MSNSTVIGLMDPAYFVNRKDILKWISLTLHLDISCIQDLGAGSVYCQLLDAYYKNAVNMSKVNWKAKFQYEFIANLKNFQQSLEKLSIFKKIDIEKLAKGKYQDNLQMAQWLKKYLQTTSKLQQDYNPVQRRNNETLYSLLNQKKGFIQKNHQKSLVSPVNCQSKKMFSPNQQNKEKSDRINKIKLILKLQQSAQTKIKLIQQVVIENRGLQEKTQSNILPESAIEEQIF